MNLLDRIEIVRGDTGIYHFPPEQAAAVAVNAVARFLIQSEKLDRAIYVCFDEINFLCIQEEVAKFR